MKRARQNTSIGALRARLLDSMDEAANSTAAVTCTPPDGPPRLVDKDELLAVCHRVHRRFTGGPDVVTGEPANPTVMQEFIPPLHDIRYAVEYHRTSSNRDPVCRVTCRRYDWRLRNSVRSSSAAGSRGPEVQLTDESLMDEISRIVAQIDSHLSSTHGARVGTIKCATVSPPRAAMVTH
jgi:hypothetical protein